MSDVLIVVNEVTLKGGYRQCIPRNSVYSRNIIQTEGLLEYAEGAAKVNIGPMYAEQKGADMVTLCYWEMSCWDLSQNPCQIWSSYYREIFPEQLKDLMLIIKANKQQQLE